VPIDNKTLFLKQVSNYMSPANVSFLPFGLQFFSERGVVSLTNNDSKKLKSS
jgi:hypothetical protein